MSGETKGKVLVPGTCRVCGCTATRACVEGCGWIAETRTLCTRCGPRVLAAEECGLRGFDVDELRARLEQLDASDPVQVPAGLLLELLEIEAIRGELVALEEASSGDECLIDPAAVHAIEGFGHSPMPASVVQVSSDSQARGPRLVKGSPREVAAQLGLRVRKHTPAAKETPGG